MSSVSELKAQACIKLLGDQVTVLTPTETDLQWELLKQSFPFSFNGKVIWDEVEKKREVGDDYASIRDSLEILLHEPINTTVYIQWSDSRLPIIKTDLDSALSIYKELANVTWEFFIFNPSQGYLIEKTRGKILVGLQNK
jgi:hypothetical protein